MAHWIWHFGDYELYHHLQLSCRREEKGSSYACMWPVTRPHFNARFYTEFTATNDTVIRVVSRSGGKIYVAGGAFAFNTDIPLPAGQYTVQVNCFDREAFPAFFIDSEFLKTGADWVSDAYCAERTSVGFDEAFTTSDADPTVFPFCYETVQPIATEHIGGGVLYDYGRELFGPVTLEGLTPDKTVRLTYGESREEALCYEDAIIRETLCGENAPTRPARAFRYLHVVGDVTPTAQYEYLPLTDTASFSCDEPLAQRIWDTCAYTFHLNSREAYFDGIKRDRWVWSGDAYQSVWVNHYLYFDPAIVRRTILSLLGHAPYRSHINMINDYSCYLIHMVWDHYMATADAAFVHQIWDDLKALYTFIVSRLDDNGYIVEQPGDWIFIDWSEHLDKGGAISAEQILLWQAHRVMGRLAVLCGEADVYTARADRLRENVLRDFWDEACGAFIDCYTTGRRNVSRQSNVFAVLYDFVDDATAARIGNTVLLNDVVPAITTPYFKLYELMALCKLGEIETAQAFIRSYWGGMIELGATTVWEQFDPNESGAEHLAMYEEPFGRSLCHAWGSGPLLLWGKNVCGVAPTAPAYATFDVRPQPGMYQHFHGVVPIFGGTVTVSYDHGTITVTASRDGGTLHVGDRSYPLSAGVPVTVR